MTHTDLLRQALDALELQEPAVGCPREREHWKRTAMPTIAALRAALAQPAPAVPAYTEGHCEEKAKKGGCQLHNLHCGYPACDRRPAAPAVPAVNCEWTNCPRRVGDVCCNERAAPAVREPHEPYLCIKPACGPDCSGCNCAISPQDMRDYAVRYAILRNAPIDAIRAGGVFAGKTPDNVVINGEHLDAAVDALRGITGDSK